MSSPQNTTPEPVLDQAKVAAAVTGILSAVLTLAAVFGYVSADESTAITTVVLALVGATVTGVNVVVPIARARIAREQVTPWSPGQATARTTPEP